MPHEIRDLLRALSPGGHPLWLPGLISLLGLTAYQRAAASGSAAAIHPATERAVARKQGGVAVVPVSGVIVAKPNIWERVGLGISTQTITANLVAAAEDPEVKAIVIDFDSPGGTISGVPETASVIRALRGGKPIVAQVNYLMASAAYWLAAQADEIVAAPSAMVGSIGVYMIHEDWSAFLENFGVKTTFIFAGEHKIDGNFDEPLSDTARKDMQAQVNEYYAMFLSDVAAGRGGTAASVRESYGDGRIFTAQQAMAVGAIDKIRSLDETLAVYGVVRTQIASRGRSLATTLKQQQLTTFNK